MDIICGGFPCQDISSAGARVGIDGERSGLWGEYARIIGELRPRFVIVENVADLLVRGFGRVLGDLAALGYDAEWHCIPAAAVGADHWRDRIWIIAYPNSAGGEPLHIGWRQQRQEEMGEDAADRDSSRLQGRLQAGTIGEDARAISAGLGLALCAPIAFPELDGAGSPVLGRGEDGIPDRVDRMHALGNSVVPQIPEIIGRAIMRASEMIAPRCSRCGETVEYGHDFAHKRDCPSPSQRAATTTARNAATASWECTCGGPALSCQCNSPLIVCNGAGTRCAKCGLPEAPSLPSQNGKSL